MGEISGEHVIPFLQGLRDITPQFGIDLDSREDMQLKQVLVMDFDVNVIIGITGDVRGNIGLAMDNGTALTLVSAMMGGRKVEELDEIAKSALGELSNLVAASSASKFAERGGEVDITPPTMIAGNELKMYISMVETISIDIQTSAGLLQMNVGLESVNL